MDDSTFGSALGFRDHHGEYLDVLNVNGPGIASLEGDKKARGAMSVRFIPSFPLI